jgi:hypothetical protein
MPFADIGFVGGIVMPDHIIGTGMRVWLQQMHGSAEFTDAVIMPDQALLLCNLFQLLMHPAGVMPQEENP